MTLDAYVLPDRQHAVLVLTGSVEAGAGAVMKTALAESEHHDSGHVTVDLRHVTGVNSDVVGALLWELGRAFDENRTLRLVVRDEHQHHFLNRTGLHGLVPVHASLEAAMSAAESAEDEMHTAHADATDT